MVSGLGFCIHVMALLVLHYKHGLEVSAGCSPVLSRLVVFRPSNGTRQIISTKSP